MNSSRRYRNKKEGGLYLDCKWCGGAAGDWIWHVATCIKFREDIRDRFGGAWYPQFPDEALPFFCLLDRPLAEEAFQRIFLADLVMNAYQSIDGSGISSIRIGHCNKARMSQWSLNRKSGYARIWRSLENGSPSLELENGVLRRAGIRAALDTL